VLSGKVRKTRTKSHLPTVAARSVSDFTKG
jgi:hypothetical protein